ncbi:MAG TPA: translation elongation factor 4 [Myxococcota bacterium]|nr:translation elongation factor 4 [Myxococcota bacterium]
MPGGDDIRNFCIIAHIDHGKSTLADRILELTGAVSARDMVDQYLDRMPLERERGITIKAQAARLRYKGYQLNLIDTPGHVDFTYEVSRALRACEGALLVVDAAQGVEAQTLANVYLALDADLTIIPVINKIDLPSADVERVRREIEDTLGLDAADALLVSAKQGLGIEELLDAVIARVPPPAGDTGGSLKALVFDSWFDSYLGVNVLMRVFDGGVKVGDRVRLMANKQDYDVTALGVFGPEPRQVGELKTGEVGFLAAGIKQVAEARVGDTVTSAAVPVAEPVPGFRDVKPMVFAGLFPVESMDYDKLRDSLEKLRLNDASIHVEPETSAALGFGFRCGFLGLLHMEIVQERLEREYDLDLITTAPTVIYRVVAKDGTETLIDNPAHLPDPTRIERIEEPIVRATVYVPQDGVGAVLALCEERRGVQKGLEYGTAGRVMITYEMPLAEIVFDFFDRLKSASRGYASLDYEPVGYRAADLIKLDILVNGEVVDALASICHRDRSYNRGRDLAIKLKEVIHRQQFEVAIQAAIGTKVIARTTVKSLRKNVTAKCYGGDITRKRKLLEKQKEGKKRMKSVGSVEIPQEAFLAVLQVD